MDRSAVARLVESSQYCAIADDSLKDEDNAAWVLELEPAVQREWIERIGWIRKVDRLAECELLGKESYSNTDSPSFLALHRAWKQLLVQGTLLVTDDRLGLLATIQQRWFVAGDRLGTARLPHAPKFDGATHLGEGNHPDRTHHERDDEINRLCIQAWDRYLDAILTYHRDDLRIATLADYETMLETLAGSFFQILPFLSPAQWEAAYHFGAVDQFYNNLRDIDEDARQGICYFPQEVLDRFGVSRSQVLDRSCIGTPEFHAMMVFWLDDYLPKLRRRAFKLVLAQDLHPSWVILRDWSLHRYARIERVLRDCQFDFVAFQSVYWEAVVVDLNGWQLSLGIDPPASSLVLQQADRAAQVAAFLKTSPRAVGVVQQLARCLQEVSWSLLDLSSDWRRSPADKVAARLL
ncbi:MAG: phytoene/squalene synthetase [Oscillatoriales cyanobacterium]|nr:MAG: phytoene/squalene synthetase [Oscillatoriales cyanobacterium]